MTSKVSGWLRAGTGRYGRGGRVGLGNARRAERAGANALPALSRRAAHGGRRAGGAGPAAAAAAPRDLPDWVPGYGRGEVHGEAKALEHTAAARFTERLAARLGHPAYDPHGDPIPAADRTLPNTPDLPLLQFTRDRQLTGELVNRPLVTLFGYGVAAVIVALNIFLLAQTIFSR